MSNTQQELRLRSAEEILDKHYKPKMHWKSYNRHNALIAMYEYAEQFKPPSPLTEDELKAKFAQYIGGENYTYDQLDTRERDTLEWFIKNRQQ